MTDGHLARIKMVHSQLEARGISDRATLDSFLQVPRENFCLPDHQIHAYDDRPLPIEEGQTISQPYIVALMTEAAKLGPYLKVLEVGTGSGYQAAILSNIVNQVYTVERIPSLAEMAKKTLHENGYRNVEVKISDGTLGWPEKGPFDAILVTAGSPSIPKALLDQLKVAGRLIIPIGDLVSQHLICVKRCSNEEYQEEDLGSVRFVPLIGQEGWYTDNLF